MVLCENVSKEGILKEYDVEETLFGKSERNVLGWFGHVEKMKTDEPSISG